MKHTKIIVSFLVATAFLFNACKKDKEVTEENKPVDTSKPAILKGSIAIDFDNVVGYTELQLNTTEYTNAAGNPFTVSKFMYYISNIQLVKADGTKHTDIESYYLIKESDLTSQSIKLDSIPAGEYTGIEFVIGVDSTRNVSGAQTGALDPSNDMFWTWNSGYIFLKMEGNSPVAADSTLSFHVGGFKSPNNTIRSVTKTFPNNLQVKNTVVNKIKMKTDLLELFTTPQNIDFSTLSQAMGGPNLITIANNYTDMISVKEIVNN